MRKTKDEWSHIRQRYLQGLESTGLRLTLRDRTWACTESGHWVALPGGTATKDPDHWWLCYDREAFQRRNALGAILLCMSPDGSWLDFGLAAAVLREIESRLPVGRARPQLNLNVFRRGSRFELQLTGGHAPLDITSRRGDLSWLAGREHAGMVAERPAPVSEPAPANPESRFFAKVTKGALRPLDPVDLAADGVYVVHARKVGAAPASASLRRILARGGPADLPPDFAEQHDHYAHGAPKR